MHADSIRSTGHMWDPVDVGCREEVENKWRDGIQLRISLIEHEENDVDEEGIFIELAAICFSPIFSLIINHLSQWLIEQRTFKV
jgi:hypothetical protein